MLAGFSFFLARLRVRSLQILRPWRWHGSKKGNITQTDKE